MGASALLRNWCGGCHCGAVRFEVRAAEPLSVLECNGSICRQTGFLHLVVPAAQFRLIQGETGLASYTFNTGTARHLFCRVCGIKSFYVPRSHPDGYSVNARCLDGVDPDSLVVTAFDGQDWERSIVGLRDSG